MMHLKLVTQIDECALEVYTVSFVQVFKEVLVLVI